MAPLQHLILILVAWLLCQALPRRDSVHVLSAFGIVALLIYAPVAGLVIAITALEAALMVVLFSALPRKSNWRQYGAYLLLLNLFFVDFHHLALNMPVAILGISFSAIRIFMTAKQLLSARKEHDRSDLYWIFAAGFYLPALVIGPVFSGLDLKAQYEKGAPEEVVLRDYRMLLLGLVLAMIVAVLMGNLAQLTTLRHSQLAAAPFYFLQLFCAFWGQSLIAEHSSRFFGYRLPVNFEAPWLARTPAEFWKRWHKSMANFVLQYIFLPLNLRGLSPKVATTGAFIFMGLWHNLSIGYFIWGLGHGLMLAFSPQELKGRAQQVLMPVALWVSVIGLSYFANYGPYA
ncbi:MAG: MBOAT family O-acyltransferase [Pseudomonadota bacterium]